MSEYFLLSEARQLITQKIPGFPESTLSDPEVKGLMDTLYAGGWKEWVADYQRIQHSAREKSTTPSIHRQIRDLKDTVRDYRFRWTLRVHEEWLSVKITSDTCTLVRRVAQTREGTHLDQIKFGLEVTIWAMIDNSWQQTYNHVLDEGAQTYRKSGRGNTIEALVERHLATLGR